MRKFIQNKLKEQKGLTLIELLAVIVILAIVAAIAIPAIGNIIENSRNGAVKSDYQNALAAANIYFTENPEKVTVTVAELLSKSYLDDAGSLNITAANAAAGLVTITAAAKGNTISGTASAKGTTYTVSSLTNALLSDIPNADFNGKQTMDATYVGTVD